MINRQFVISDIHGCLKTFQTLLEIIGFSKSDTLILLGDYIDRGPDSVGVIHYIQQLIKDEFDVICLMGNHEKNLLALYTSDAIIWERLGGRGFKKRKEEPVGMWRGWSQTDLNFMTHLKPFYFFKNFIFVHAGLNFKWSDPLGDTDSMLRIRNWYQDINYKWLSDKIIVHGHTRSTRSAIESARTQIVQNQYINIDASCAYNFPNDSYLCALCLTDLKLTFQPNIEAEYTVKL